MFQILRDILGYSGSSMNNFDSYIVYGSITLILLVAVVGVDNILKFFRSIMPKNKYK